ncbi:MAG: DNA repair protein RadC [Bacilli bacterium]|nr:DNA repair protein RadC [Bacilli bacterium]
MSYLIKELPDELKPRERFKKYGVSSLSDEELISILMRCGTKEKSVKELSIEVLKSVSVCDFRHVSFAYLKGIKGIGEVKAMTLVAAVEFGRRVLSNKDNIKQIKCSSDVYELVKDEMEGQLQEKLLVIFLDNRKNVLLKKIIFVGTVNSSSVYPRDVFREAVKCNAVGLILVHNHPAGSINPSYQDVYLTNQFIKIGKLMEIEVVDHVIIGLGSYYSFLESNGDLFENDS